MALIEGQFQIENRDGGLGVSCTREGVSLAGVPLLRKTIAGLKPRPMDELAVLLKSAYGHDIDPTRSCPGLDVIAEALNQGDIGRAMVATVHLRLPVLNKVGAAHITLADQALNKFDPNEPRDERGRWTTGDGSPSTGPMKPSRRLPELGGAGIKPIFVADGPGGGPPIESLLVNMTISRQCIKNAHEPNYYKKTQNCALVFEQCKWLVEVNGDNSLRRDACLWPDGAAAMMKFGVMVPIRVGHPF